MIFLVLGVLGCLCVYGYQLLMDTSSQNPLFWPWTTPSPGPDKSPVTEAAKAIMITSTPVCDKVLLRLGC